MAGINRALIYSGPAVVFKGSQPIYCAGDVKVVMGVTKNMISVCGDDVGARVKDRVVTIQFTPAEYITAVLSACFPYTGMVSGTDPTAGTDEVWTVHPLNGKEKIALTSGFVTKMPDLKLGLAELPFGEMEVQGVLGLSTDPSNAAALYTLTATSAFSDSAFASSQVLTAAMTAAISGGSSPWDAFYSETGFNVKFALEMNATYIAGLGTVGYRFGSLGYSLACRPAGITVAQCLARFPIQGSGATIGQAMEASGADMTIAGPSGGYPTVTLKNMTLETTPSMYGDSALRIGDVNFLHTRKNRTTTQFSIGLTV